MYTRTQYINGECTHSEYYRQFVNDNTIARVKVFIAGRELDAIPLTFHECRHKPSLGQCWDSLGLTCDVVDAMKQAGDGYSLAGAVCVNKRAAEMIRGDA